jgi:N-methylhydantoinase B
MPVEATEAITPVIFWRKELRSDSGGAGRSRGGLGQVIELGGAAGIPFDVLAMFERVDHPPRGREGGGEGAAGRVALASGTQLRSKGQQSIPAHDRLVLEMAGGGGFGDPHERDARQVAEDVRNGFVSRESARDDYGVVLDAEGQVDEAATAAARGV